MGGGEGVVNLLPPFSPVTINPDHLRQTRIAPRGRKVSLIYPKSSPILKRNEPRTDDQVIDVFL